MASCQLLLLVPSTQLVFLLSLRPHHICYGPLQVKKGRTGSSQKALHSFLFSGMSAGEEQTTHHSKWRAFWGGFALL